MARKVFFSFHFDNDHWRTQQVRQIGTLEGQTFFSPNLWEEEKKKGKDAIEKWIDNNLEGKSCVVVLVGSETADRYWVRREIAKGWSAKKGVVGIRIDKLLNSDGESSEEGENPFKRFTLKDGKEQLSDYVKLKVPSGKTGKEAYASIAENIEAWIEEAIQIRKDYK